jgi:hypothetical protein
MSYWYPTQGRADALTVELDRLKRLPASHFAATEDLLLDISKTLVAARNKDGFPQHQISNWVWLSSQFRLISNTNDDEAISARAALGFLSQRMQKPALTDTDIQDLNWVLDMTVRKLSHGTKPDVLRSGLSGAEILAIEAKLARFASDSSFNPADIKAQIEDQVREFTAFSTDRRFDAVQEKIDCLLKAADDDGINGRVARSALTYLAEKDDVVSDELGVLGLLDDIYVVDWAYAVITHQTRCLPILDSFIEKWPFLADVALLGKQLQQLDLYSQYVAGACLHQLFEAKGPSLLILRESAAYGLICGFMAAVQCARLHSDALEREIGSWAKGQQVIIGDGSEQFRAVFHSAGKLGNKDKIWLGVRGGTITVDLAVKPYIARTTFKDKPLANGADILSWLKQRHLDPLVGLVGDGRRSLEQQECVLLLSPKNKIDTYFEDLRPFGVSVSALVGAKYVTSDQNVLNIGRQVSDTPFIYACSDPSTALDLIRNPPAHVSGWRVVVDGARHGRVLLSTLRGEADSSLMPICILGEMHEREWASEVARNGASLWYLEAGDVQTVSPNAASPDRNDDNLLRSIKRQGGYNYQNARHRNSQSTFLEAAAGCLAERVGSKDQGSQMASLDMAVSSFVQKAISLPLNDRHIEAGLAETAQRIASHASTLSLYDPRAGKVLQLFKDFTLATAKEFDRRDHLASIIRNAGQSKSIAIVCRSTPAVEKCVRLASGMPDFRKVSWITMAAVRKSAPFDNLIVPGWLDRLSMRELANNGYAKELDLVLFPFEQRWFNATVAANQRWEQQARRKTVGVLKAIAGKIDAKHGKGSLWRQPADERLSLQAYDPPAVSDPIVSDVPEFEILEARAIEALRTHTSIAREGQAMAKAQLVLFEEDGAYAFMPPDGQVIVLSGAGTKPDQHLLSNSSAESILFRNVSTLRPGMVLAFSQGTDRDLIDARADQFLPKTGAVRETANIWKEALKKHVEATPSGYSRFAERMAAQGHPRHPLTVRAWMAGTQSIAPKKYRVVVPLIAQLTGSAELKQHLDQVLKSIDLIYRARSEAAEAIVRELFSGEIDLNASTLDFKLNDRVVQYCLYRVRRVAGIQEVPFEIIGKVQTVGSVLELRQGVIH